MNSKIGTFIAVTASVITIINFLYSVFFSVNITSLPDIPKDIQGIPLVTRFVILVILEVTFVYWFGLLFGRFAKQQSPADWLLFIIVGLSSAWVSVFNLKALLFYRTFSSVHNPYWNWRHSINLFVLLVIIAIISGFVVSKHIQNAMADSGRSPNDKKNVRRNGVAIQSLAFLVIFIVLFIQHSSQSRRSPSPIQRRVTPVCSCSARRDIFVSIRGEASPPVQYF